MNNSMFIERPDGEYDVTPPGILMLVASAVYGDPAETTPQGRENGRKLIEGILATAVAGGFKQRDILETLLARNDHDRRTMDMAQAACDSASNDALVRIITRAGL